MSRFFRGRPSRGQARDPEDAGAADLALTVLLARREHATSEAREKLLAQGYAAPVVDQVLADFSARRLLDDARYAGYFVASHAGRGHGPLRIRQQLGQIGLPEALIHEALAAGPDFRVLCRELRARKFGATPPCSWDEKGRQTRFLQYRGFSLDHITSALGPDIELE